MDNMINLKITQDGKEHDIVLPTDKTAFENITVIQITDSVCPMLKEMDINDVDVSALNNFAVQLRQISDIGKLPKLNAVLSANQCSSVDQAILLAERLEHFNLDAEIKNYTDLVYDELENVIGGRQAEELRLCLDIEKYGRILQQGYNAEFTEYGMVTRDDCQPMDAPWQDESEVMDRYADHMKKTSLCKNKLVILFLRPYR